MIPHFAARSTITIDFSDTTVPPTVLRAGKNFSNTYVCPVVDVISICTGHPPAQARALWEAMPLQQRYECQHDLFPCPTVVLFQSAVFDVVSLARGIFVLDKHLPPHPAIDFRAIAARKIANIFKKDKLLVAAMKQTIRNIHTSDLAFPMHWDVDSLQRELTVPLDETVTCCNKLKRCHIEAGTETETTEESVQKHSRKRNKQ